MYTQQYVLLLTNQMEVHTSMQYLSIFQRTVWFNIGSVEAFERNFENAQVEMNIEPSNFIPVVYKTETEV